MSKYLFIDTETGGIGLDKSLLTAGFVFTDTDYNVQYEYHARLKPNDGIYHVTAEALSINKIDLVEHNKLTQTYKEFGTILYNMLLNSCNNEKIVVFGKNVHFDLAHIWDKVISRATWEQFCSYQVVDLTSVWKYLEISGKVPVLPKTSLGNIAKHLEIKEYNEDHMHDAVYDTTITMLCFKEINEKF
jgi:DNA polymerase III epsilon subunit-like protein